MTRPLVSLRAIRHRYEIRKDRSVTVLELDELDEAHGERLAL